MPSVFVASFAVAGAIAAAAPIVIHLLNRRRFRVVEWAAMDFLQQALRRSRRILHLRDLLLLTLRTLCVLLFGLAMARPYLQRSGAAADPDQPVHAVLAIDNSLSMSYERIDGTLLDEAKQRAREYLGQLPQGSWYSILPMCAFAGEFSLEPYRTREDALEAIEAIRTVDRAANMPRVLDLVRDACRRGKELPAKRVVAFGDQQQANWPQTAFERIEQDSPDMQVVKVAADRPENAWVADFRVVDSLADVESPAILAATIGYDGAETRRDVQVTLEVDGAVAATRTIDLEPGQQREVTFSHRFELAVEPGKTSHAAAKVSLPPDRLPDDDLRVLVVPVVAALPVVFVDEWGDAESPSQQQYGETYRWRRLLAPITSKGEVGKQLIAVRHLRIDQVDRERLKDARLVVIAGVESPRGATEVLREYVEQGGQLVLAAGGKFDAAAWQKEAWNAGKGVLPLPLKNEYVGVTADSATDQLNPFFLAPASLVHDYFQIETLSNDDRADLFRLPLFFKTAVVDDAEPHFDEAAKHGGLTRRPVDAPASPNAANPAEKTAQKSASSVEPLAGESTLPRTWLTWVEDDLVTAEEINAAELQSRRRPRVIARYGNELPYLVEREIGKGQVLLVASGVQASWNTLMTTHAALLFDRIFRTLIERTLPRRTFGTLEQVTLPIAARDRQQRFTLQRPGKNEEPLWVDALGGEAYALPIRNLAQRGIYRVHAQRPEEDRSEDKLWETVLAVNGPAEESRLRMLTSASFAERTPQPSLRWVDRGDSISLAGAMVLGQDWWRWLMGAVLLCLLAEWGVLLVSQRAVGTATPGAAP